MISMLSLIFRKCHNNVQLRGITTTITLLYSMHFEVKSQNIFHKIYIFGI